MDDTKVSDALEKVIDGLLAGALKVKEAEAITNACGKTIKLAQLQLEVTAMRQRVPTMPAFKFVSSDKAADV